MSLTNIKHLATGDSPLTAHNAESKIRQLILERGPLSWSEVMALALYDPECGYYGSKVRKIGRRGDFYTAVSVGEVYGSILAEVAQQVWRAAGQPEEFVIAEQAGHDGQLAADIWTAVQKLPLGKTTRWVMIEPQPVYREAQSARLTPLMAERITWIDHISQLHGTGLLVCNELLDAFPVDRLRWNGQCWEECCVTLENDALAWTTRPTTEQEGLPDDLPAGYTTETHAASRHWAEQLSASRWSGAVLIADYGYDADVYYAPERTDGTLRRYTQHGCDGEVLADLGNCDLTAHINFTLVRNTLSSGGWQEVTDLPQGRFLTQAGMRWLQALDELPMSDRMSKIRQFQSLTHPGHMGAAFRMLLMSRGLTNRLELPTLGS